MVFELLHNSTKLMTLVGSFCAWSTAAAITGQRRMNQPPLSVKLLGFSSFYPCLPGHNGDRASSLGGVAQPGIRCD
jgi:hypothetical protein